jgi:hypothetical protein
MAPLIMVTHPTVSSFFSTCECFLRDGRSSSGDLPSLSLACEWPLGGDLGLKILQVQGKGRPNRPRDWARLAGLGRPAQAHLGPVRLPLRARGSSGDYALCPLHLHDFGDVILTSKMKVLLA